MRAPRLRTLIELIQPVEAPDALGGTVTTYDSLIPALILQAEFKDVPVSKVVTEASTDTMRRAVLTVRTLALPSGFSEQWRVLAKGLTYSIMRISDLNDSGRFSAMILTREN